MWEGVCGARAGEAATSGFATKVSGVTETEGCILPSYLSLCPGFMC